MKQWHVPIVGKLYMQFAVSALYFTGVNFFMQAVTLYQVAGASWAARYTPWLSLPLFLLLAAVGMYSIMNLHWTFIEKSKNAVSSQQSYIDQNPAVQDLKQLKEDMRKVKEKLGVE